jgi:hypothetical protein
MLSFLRRTEKFYEFILFAWDHVEFFVDEVVMREFGSELFGDRREFILGTSFGRKLALLKDLGRISNEEYHKIERFQKERNVIVHSQGWSEADSMTKIEREKVMDEADVALGILTELYLGPEEQDA